MGIIGMVQLKRIINPTTIHVLHVYKERTQDSEVIKTGVTYQSAIR